MCGMLNYELNYPDFVESESEESKHKNNLDL